MSRVILVSVMIFALLLLFLSAAMGQAEQFLVGYWPFDEGAGKEAKDASGNGHDGELNGDAQWVQGKFDKALDFGAGGGYIAVPARDHGRCPDLQQGTHSRRDKGSDGRRNSRADERG